MERGSSHATTRSRIKTSDLSRCASRTAWSIPCRRLFPRPVRDIPTTGKRCGGQKGKPPLPNGAIRTVSGKNRTITARKSGKSNVRHSQVVSSYILSFRPMPAGMTECRTFARGLVACRTDCGRCRRQFDGFCPIRFEQRTDSLGCRPIGKDNARLPVVMNRVAAEVH
jgi:hypothetical protein